MVYNQGLRCWGIRCEPHVAIRLKRVFGKLGKGSVGWHLISDTPENARDILWFCGRYPLRIEDGRLGARADEYQQQKSMVESIIESGIAGISTDSFKLEVPARDYQKVAAKLALASGELLLADDVGLGKTCSAICVLTDPRTRPALVVTLTHLPRQWKAEFNRFVPGLKVHIIKQGTPYELRSGRGSLFSASSFPDVLIINYHKLHTWAETLAKLCKSVCFDECQELRRPGTAKYDAAEHIAHAMKFRMGLSATPIYNYGAEFWTVLNCIAPGKLGTAAEFSEEWCGGSFKKITNPKAFGCYLRDSGLMLQRTCKEVGRELPKVQVVPHYIDCDSAAIERISGSCAEMAKFILSQGPSARGAKLQAAEEMSNLMRQATGISKAPFVAEFVRMLVEQGEKVVLYGWHRAVYDIWLERLKDLKPVLYTGTESVPQKEASKLKFVKGDSQVFCISLRSGAGLDGLQQACRIVVFGELDYSPAVHWQNIGRVNRDGQKEMVTAYYLLSEEGSDPTVSEILGLKRQQIEGVRPPGDEELVEKLQNDGSHVRRLAEAIVQKYGRQNG